jgi:hypothetical protein
MTCAKLAVRAGLIIAYSALWCLIVFSIFEAFETIREIIHDVEKDNNILLAGALAAALVPSGAMLFWAWKAIGLHLPLSRLCQPFRMNT